MSKAKAKYRDRIQELVRVPASELIDNPDNPREHGSAQRAAMAGILGEVGWVDGLIAVRGKDKKLRLVNGHLRKGIAGDELVPVLVVDLTPAEAKKVLATFDPVGAMATANAAAMERLLAGVSAQNADVAKMLADLAASIEKPAPPVVEDDVPPVPKKAITQAGDLIQLGEHRLLCGDSTDGDSVSRLFGGQRAGLLFTSPPYGQQRDYGAAKEQVQGWEGLMRGVFQHAGVALDAAGQILVNLGLIHRDGEWLPYWDGWIGWMREQGWRRFGWYVWDQMHGLRGDWSGRCAPSHEFIFHFNQRSLKPNKWQQSKHAGEKGGALRNKDGGFSKVTTPAIQQTKLPDSVWRVQRQKGGINGHPAPFSVALASFALNSWPGLTYEPFCGSGTTIIAAEQLNRRCYGIEIDPLYCDVIIQRWEQFTGKKAKRLARRA